MFGPSSICSCLELWSVNHTSIYKYSELKVFRNIKYLSELSINLPNNLNHLDNHHWQYYNGLILLQ